MRGMIRADYAPGPRCAEEYFHGWTGCVGKAAALAGAIEQIVSQPNEESEAVMFSACTDLGRPWWWGHWAAAGGSLPDRFSLFLQTIEVPNPDSKLHQFWRFRVLKRQGFVSECLPVERGR